MSAEWRKFNLGDLTDWSSGGTPSKKNTEFWIGTIPWISASSMRSTRYSESELKITPEGLKSGSRLAPMGSILLLVRGSILHQKIPVGITTRDVAFNQDVKAIQIKRHLVDSEVIDNWYLFYWFKANEKLLLSIVESTGIGAGKLDTKQLQGLEVDVPSWGEQQQIVACCKAIEEKEIINAQINQTLEQMAQAIFKSWFVDFEPVKAKIAALEASGSEDDALLAAMQVISGKDPQQLTQLQTESPEHYTTLRATAELFPAAMQESELGEIPVGWPLKKLGDFLQLKGGLSYKGAYLGDGVPMVTMGCIDPYGRFNYSGTKLYSGEFKAQHELHSGDLVVSTRDVTQARITLGAPAIIPAYLGDKVILATNMYRLEVFDYLPNLYIFELLRTQRYREQIIASAKGTTVLMLTKDAFLKYQIAIPPKQLIERATSLLNPLYEKSIQIERESFSLKSIRDTLLPKLLSGELSVNQDVE